MTTIDVSGFTKLEFFITPNNPLLRSIYMKNNLNSSYDIYYSYSIGYNCPNLQYICADESDIYEIKQRLLSAGNTNNVFFNSFCNSTSDGSHYTLNGNIKLDADNNGCTSTDPIYPNIKLKIKNAVDSGYAIANAQGNFAVELYSGTYTLRPELTNNYFIVTPTSTNVTFPEDTIPQIFCITPNGINHDVSVNLVPVHPVRPGFSDGIYKIVLKNKGNQFENGFILFNYDENKQDYISSSQTPSSIQSGQLTFTFSNLQLFETREILVTMRTNAPTDNPAVNVGDILVLSASANINMDENLDDNTQQINQTVIGSVDPNDKTCLEGNIITPNLVGKYVNYLIRFENTGTANAENVVVTDFIDLAKFDISSLQVTSTSHSCKTLISNGNKVQFVFDNINLPFTEPLKHGYVAFKIKTKPNLVIGDSLKNSADIYFDYNLPIKTNTASTRIDNIILGTKNTTNKDGSLSVYPNPSNGNFTVNFESKGNFPITIKMIDLKGSVVLEKNINHSEKSTFSFNDKDLPNGIYLININTEKENWLQKLMIVK